MSISKESINIIPHILEPIDSILYSNKKNNQFICFDKNYIKAIAIFSKIHNKYNNSTLIIYTDNYTSSPQKNITFKHITEANIMYTELFHSEYMFLFDNTDESYYNLSLSLLVNVIPIFNKKYEEFITQCGILIDDSNNVEHLLETINNSQIKKKY